MTEQAKHTPWSVKMVDNKPTWCVITNNRGEIIATCVSHDCSFSVPILMASAPDLLEALEMMLADPDAVENVNFAKAMIAKAKGGVK